MYIDDGLKIMYNQFSTIQSHVENVVEVQTRVMVFQYCHDVRLDSNLSKK